MKNRHGRSAKSTEGLSGGTARRIRTATVAVAVLALAAYGYVRLEDGPDQERPVAACSGCADSTASLVEGEAGSPATGELSVSSGLGGRLVGAIRGILNVLGAAWRSADTAGDGTILASDTQCERGMPDSFGRCRHAGAGGYPGWPGGPSTGARSAHLSSISGRVMDANGLGIEGISVTVVAIGTLAESDNRGRGTVTRPPTATDASGFYEFQGLPTGDYEVRTAASDGYGPGRLAARSGVQNADILLVPDDNLVIEGTVLGVAGERLESVTVLPVLVGVASVQTDAFGGYRLEVPVKPGTRSFLVRFQLPGFLEQSVPVDLAGRRGTGSLALNVKMHAIQTWTSVSGVVRSATGSPLQGRSVSLRRVGGRTAYTTTTDSRGRYSLDAVEAPVAYYLSVSGAPDHEDYRQKIDVAPNAATFNVVANTFDFGTVSGRLVSADGSPVSNLDLVLRNKASRSPSAVVSSDMSGNFHIAHAPAGELTIASQSSPSILARGLRLAPGEELDVALVLDWGGHELHGIVVDSSGNPVPAAKVLLTWSHLEGDVTTSTIRRTRSDAQGVFSFGQLGPGPHELQIDLPGRRPVKMIHDVIREGYFVKVSV